MRDLASALDQFAYHPATPETAPKHAAVRSLFADTVTELWSLVPDGPEKTLALRALQQSAMFANLAIALTVPVDSATPEVARILPPTYPSGSYVDSQSYQDPGPGQQGRALMDKVTRQIRDAFIDGYMSGRGDDRDPELRREALRAWRDENTTNPTPA